MCEEQWAGEELSYTPYPWHLGLFMYSLGARVKHSDFLAAEERDRSNTNMWLGLYLGLSTFLGVKGIAHCPNRHGSEMRLQGAREERKTEFQL